MKNDPIKVGRKIRKLLKKLGTEKNDFLLREQALNAAGICWKQPGELLPYCGCHPGKEFLAASGKEE